MGVRVRVRDHIPRQGHEADTGVRMIEGKAQVADGYLGGG